MMGQKKIKRAIAISGVIGGMVLLKATPVYAVENIEDNIDYPQVENINVRMASKGQVVNVDGTYLRIRSSATTESSVLGTMIEGSKFDIISKSYPLFTLLNIYFFITFQSIYLCLAPSIIAKYMATSFDI